ncbi:hypothetical protein RHMOL_Rhmol12G0172500 [Rhododendron molle]|uniref:Uncharacterized protein n=3 Tax=Rhododendron molle TaxID=49168 RepID=A0ACC0LKS4_RHOML|nr:hypothetical protein RHMOL_Rhmol12G0172500 [Rhododendron molle]KAI8528762.1 hypothetical protein RHMOL_Rhmol12G0172500 [Rhododendron molle]KAI8528763.1 hypothetical protein RHMOL_Rhmol12G0172500 [Rhododendron molle]
MAVVTESVPDFVETERGGERRWCWWRSMAVVTESVPDFVDIDTFYNLVADTYSSKVLVASYNYSTLACMDAEVSYTFHSGRKLHPDKFKNQFVNQRELTPPFVDDGLLEIVGFKDAWHGLVLL